MTNVFTNEHATINGRNVWLHMVATDIGNIFIVQHENEGMEVITKLFFNDLDEAELVYRREVKSLLCREFNVV